MIMRVKEDEHHEQQEHKDDKGRREAGRRERRRARPAARGVERVVTYGRADETSLRNPHAVLRPVLVEKAQVLTWETSD